MKRATETGAKALQAAEQGMEESMSAFVAWAGKHGVDIDDALSRQDAPLKMRMGEPGQNTPQLVREGFRLWKEAGMPVERFRMAQLQFSDGSKSDAWQYLRAN